MQRCWFANTDYRPTFTELKNELSELLSVASDNLYIRNVTQELPYTYYLNEEYLLLPKQFVCENAYVKLMSDEAGYMNDGFDRRYSEAINTRKVSTSSSGISASKINASTAFWGAVQKVYPLLSKHQLWLFLIFSYFAKFYFSFVIDASHILLSFQLYYRYYSIHSISSATWGAVYATPYYWKIPWLAGLATVVIFHNCHQTLILCLPYLLLDINQIQLTMPW